MCMTWTEVQQQFTTLVNMSIISCVWLLFMSGGTGRGWVVFIRVWEMGEKPEKVGDGRLNTNMGERAIKSGILHTLIPPPPTHTHTILTMVTSCTRQAYWYLKVMHHILFTRNIMHCPSVGQTTGARWQVPWYLNWFQTDNKPLVTIKVSTLFTLVKIKDIAYIVCTKYRKSEFKSCARLWGPCPLTRTCQASVDLMFALWYLVPYSRPGDPPPSSNFNLSPLV